MKLFGLAIICSLYVSAVAAADEPAKIRVATFNISLVGEQPHEVAKMLSSRDYKKAQAIAEIIQRVNPDLLLLNELDYDADQTTIERFLANYLAAPQNISRNSAGPATAIEFPYRFLAPVNTGIASGCDLDGDGIVGAQIGTPEYARDAIGYGAYPGQYGMVVLSKYPILTEQVRTFQMFLWKDMPGALLPDRQETAEPADWYSRVALSALRLSSKSHWDVPVKVAGKVLHVLASHPTPPVFDGAEDRNGRRNHDEIRFWSDYLTPTRASYIYDDLGKKGGLGDSELFVILGDLNADPCDGSPLKPTQLLIQHPCINSQSPPRSRGAVQAAGDGVNLRHRGNPEFDTGDFPNGGQGPGNLRTDYVLPSATLAIDAACVFWPEEQEPLFPLVGRFPFPSSDHRLARIDIPLPSSGDSISP